MIAAQLMAHGAGAPKAKDLVMRALENLLAALREAPPAGSYWLLLVLVKLRASADDARAAEALLGGLKSDDAELATRLAETMLEADPSEFPLFATLTPRFREVFEHWAHKRRVSRDGRWLKAALVRLLGEARLLRLNDLMQLCFDDLHDVRRAARRTEVFQEGDREPSLFGL